MERREAPGASASTDESEEVFNATLKRMAKSPPPKPSKKRDK
jgi:hypothetical protein